MTKLALSLLLLMKTTGFAQHGNDEQKFVGRVKADNPTVYLLYACQEKQNVYLRMHNNTVWHLSVTTDELYAPRPKITLRNGVATFALPNDKAISLLYRVEKWALPWEHVKVPKLNYADNGFSNWIASQDSILFSVPVEYLRKDLQVFVRFEYEWEVPREGYSMNDPEHRVSFRGLDFHHTKPMPCT